MVKNNFRREVLSETIFKENSLSSEQINGPEMKFLDISLTKDSSPLLHAIHSPFYKRILKKTILFLQKITRVYSVAFCKMEN